VCHNWDLIFIFVTSDLESSLTDSVCDRKNTLAAPHGDGNADDTSVCPFLDTLTR